MQYQDNNRIRNIITISLILGTTLFFLLAFIDADPSAFKRWGDVGDEGYWIASAKNLYTNGSLRNGIDNNTQAHIGAPLYTALVFVVFKIFGISVTAARAISTVFAVMVLAVILSSNLSRESKYFSSAALILSVTFQAYAVWATPVMMQAFFEVLTVVLLLRAIKVRSKLYGFFAGISSALVVASKLSGYIFTPIPIIILLYHSIKDKNLSLLNFFMLGSICGIMPIAGFFCLYPEDVRLFLSALAPINRLVNDTFPWVAPSLFNLFAFRRDPVYLGLVALSLPALLVLTLALVSKKVRADSFSSTFSIITLWLLLLSAELILIADKSDRRVFLSLIPTALFVGVLLDIQRHHKTHFDSLRILRISLRAIVICVLGLGAIKSHLSFTMRTWAHSETTRKLNYLFSSGDCVDGVLAHWFTEGTLATPIWFNKERPLSSFNGPILPEASTKCDRTYLISGLFQGENLGHYYRSSSDFNAGSLAQVMKIQIPATQEESQSLVEGKNAIKRILNRWFGTQYIQKKWRNAQELPMRFDGNLYKFTPSAFISSVR